MHHLNLQTYNSLGALLIGVSLISSTSLLAELVRWGLVSSSAVRAWIDFFSEPSLLDSAQNFKIRLVQNTPGGFMDILKHFGNVAIFFSDANF